MKSISSFHTVDNKGDVDVEDGECYHERRAMSGNTRVLSEGKKMVVIIHTSLSFTMVLGHIESQVSYNK